MNLEKSLKMIAAAIDEAKKLGVAEVIAVVDSGGNLIALNKMDGAPLGAIELAIAKARTAASFGFPTKEFYDFVMNDEVLKNTKVPGACLIPGGIPVEGGAIGASGAHWSQDLKCAKRAAEEAGKKS